MNVIASVAEQTGKFVYQQIVEEPVGCGIVVLIAGQAAVAVGSMYSTAWMIAALVVTTILCLAILFISCTAEDPIAQAAWGGGLGRAQVGHFANHANYLNNAAPQVAAYNPYPYRNARDLAFHGINLHDNGRDQKTTEALRLLKGAQGTISSAEITKAVRSFTTYLETDPGIKAETRRLARKALQDNNPMLGFIPLLGDPYCGRHAISGDEVIARHWSYACNYRDPIDPARSLKEQTNAKLGMITALSTCFEWGETPICNEGKVQHIVVHVLQGRLPGVDIEQMPDFVPTATAVNMFFNVEARKKIDKLDDLLAAAEKFCRENNKIEKIGFLADIKAYAANMGIE